MDIIRDISRKLGFIDTVEPAAQDALQELRGNLSRALTSLSEELYSKDAHFLLEFIQNADDNDYPPGVTPTLEISLDTQTRLLTIKCNERGFEEANVRALSKVGASTKRLQEGYIGEKGIGFKSVFKITNRVYVASRGYTFYYDKNEELGMIRPIWTNEITASEGWTTFRLTLTDSLLAEKMKSHLADLQPSLLLFLRRLRHITINTDGRKQHFHCKKEDKIATLRTNDTNFREPTSEELILSNCEVRMNVQEPKRPGISRSRITLGFPIGGMDGPVLPDRSMYAFLPLRTYGFKFLIQGDFLTASSREDVLTDLRWNQALRDAIPLAFLQVVPIFKENPALRFKWLRLIPDRISDTFMRPVQNALVSKLKTEPIVMGMDGSYHLPSDVLMKPYLGPDERPLVPYKYLQQRRYYLSDDYDLHKDESRLRSLGVSEMSQDDFVSALARMGRSLSEQDEEWHEKMCTLLYNRCSSLRERIRSLPIVPLADGSWATAQSRGVHFASGGTVPTDLDIKFVTPVSQSSSRYRLFKWMGIKVADPTVVAGHILNAHSGLSPRVTASASLVHIRYLFEHRHKIERLLATTNLFIGTRNSGLARSSNLYMDHPRHVNYPLSSVLPNPSLFVSSEFMQPSRSVAEFNAWCDWLRDCLGIHASPRLLNGSWSPEFSQILNSLPTRELLLVLRQYWGDVKDKIRDSPNALAELRSTDVTTTGGLREELQSTFLRTEVLSGFNDLPFLPVDDPDNPEWAFLKDLGVCLSMGVQFSLKRLIRLSGQEGIPRDEVERLYRGLDVQFDEAAKEIRDGFKNHCLVYARRPESEPTGRYDWLGLSDVVWAAPSSVRSKCQLRFQYPYLQRLFGLVGVPLDCPSDVLLDEIRPISAKFRGAAISESVHERISDILLDINAALSYTTRTDQIEGLDWLQQLQQEAIFPVRVPGVGLSLLSVRDTFYVPDRGGFFATMFSDSVPLLADLVRTRGSKKPSSCLKYLLANQHFQPHLRVIDQVVTSQVDVKGERIPDDRLSEDYTGRIPYFRRVIPSKDVDGHQYPSLKFSRVKVYDAEHVTTKYTIGDVTREYNDQLTLQFDNTDTLTAIFTTSCAEETRALVLSRKLGAYFNLPNPASIALVLQTPHDQLEATFSGLGIVALDDDDDGDEVRNEDIDGISFRGAEENQDFDSLFASVMGVLTESASRLSLSHSDRYSLVYRPGTVQVSKDQHVCIFASPPGTLGIDLPAFRNASRKGGSSSSSSKATRDAEVLTTISGEYFAYDSLRKNLPNFGLGNWTSSLRGQVAGIEPFRGTSSATFTYQDAEGTLTEFIYGSERRDKWVARWPTYLLQVKTTEGGVASTFPMTHGDFQTAAEFTIRDPELVPETIYAILRVSNLLQGSRSLRIYPDPHRLLYDGQIAIRGRTWAATPA